MIVEVFPSVYFAPLAPPIFLMFDGVWVIHDPYKRSSPTSNPRIYPTHYALKFQRRDNENLG